LKELKELRELRELKEFNGSEEFRSSTVQSQARSRSSGPGNVWAVIANGGAQPAEDANPVPAPIIRDVPTARHDQL